MNLSILKKASILIPGMESNNAQIAPQNEFVWTREIDAKYVPLDDVLQVNVVEKSNIRQAVRTFLHDHCKSSRGISFVAGRGKLTAELIALAENRVVFGDLVKSVKRGLQRSEHQPLRGLDPRELARILCRP